MKICLLESKRGEETNSQKVKIIYRGRVLNDFVPAVDDSSKHIDGGDFLVEAFELFADRVSFSCLFSCLDLRD